MKWFKKVSEGATEPVADGRQPVQSQHGEPAAMGTPNINSPEADSAQTGATTPPVEEALADLGCAATPQVVTPVTEFTQPEGERPRSLACEVCEAVVAASQTMIEEVARELKRVADRQEELHNLFESRIYSDDVQGKALEKLHDQLRDYRQNFIREEMKPLLRDLTFCYDFAAEELEAARVSARGGQPPSAESNVRTFEHFLQMIGDVLSKYDIEAFRSEGDGFDQRTQQCIRTVPTGVEADHKRIAAVGAVGFRSADLILRKEQVTVYKYTPGFGADAREATPGIEAP